MGLDIYTIGPPQTYIFRGVDTVFFFCGPNLYFSWDFHVYIYKNMYFHIFTRSLRDEETKMI